MFDNDLTSWTGQAVNKSAESSLQSLRGRLITRVCLEWPCFLGCDGLKADRGPSDNNLESSIIGTTDYLTTIVPDYAVCIYK